MGLAVKAFDMVVGVDTHIILIPTPAGPVPTPLPNPFVGMMFDAADWLPGGATVFINGLPRGKAGSAAKAMPPHMPLGGPFAKPPSNDGELFMGSATVIVDGDPMGYSMLPVLTCQDIGMPAPPRATKKSAPKSMYLPTSVVMSIPAGAPVLIGGPPTISMNVVVGKVQDAALGRVTKMLAKTKLGKAFERVMKGGSDRLHKLADKVYQKLGVAKDAGLRNLVSRGICAVTGHPVDIATGKLFTDVVDFVLPGPLPFKLERVWFSTSTYQGPLGHGWHASLDMAVAVDELVVGVRLGDGRVVLFPALRDGASHFDARERLMLTRIGADYRLRESATGLTYSFAAHRARATLPLISVEDRNGFAITFQQDEQGRPAQIIDAGGRRWDLRYHPRSRQLCALEGPHPQDEGQRVVYQQWDYDDHGNLLEARDALGQAQRFTYDRHLLVRETNRRGLSFYFQYDGRDHSARCTRTWGDGGIYDHKLTYDLARNITTVENSLGFKSQYEHDGAMVQRRFDVFGNLHVTEYDDGYRVVAEIDPLGQRTSSEYDARGNLVKRMESDGASVQIAYDAHDLPVRAVDTKGGVWTWSRDERGRLLESENPLEHSTRFVYQQRWLVSIVDPAGGTTAIGYDATGELDTIAAPNNALTVYHRDRLGRVVAVVDARGNTQRCELDLLGRVVRVQEPEGNVRTLAYDPEGNVLHAQDAQHDVRFTYQGMNRLASRSEAGTTVQFRYDTEEQLTSIVNEHGAVYRFVLGPTGEVDEEHGFDGLLRHYMRDRAGRVIRVERPGERFSEYSYDAGGRVGEVKHSDESEESFSYDADGALTRAANRDVTVSFTRDALGRVIREDQDGAWIESEHDALGMRVRMRSSLGADQIIERNAIGDVMGVGEASSGFEASFTRDQLGLELERALPGGLHSRWQRDQVGRPVEHVVTAGAKTLRATGYKWEVNDRLRRVIDGLRGPIEYTHDELGNLAGARYSDGTVELRMPDAVGNLFRSELRGDRKYGPAGQLLVSFTPEGETRYAYDVEGNLIGKTEPSGAHWRYSWNAAGMLSRVQRPDGSEVTFAYDALGRRVRKTYRGQTTRWVWDGNVPLHEWVAGRLTSLADAGGVPWFTAHAAQRKREAELESLLAQGPPDRGSKEQPITWLFEPDSFAPMARLVAGETQSIVCDYLGTPVLMADGDGARVWGASLSVYGELRDLEGQRWACPFRWPGQYEDAETGLYYNRFRYYDPEAGQYCSQDPIGLAGGAAVHAYARDPLLAKDPLGLSELCGQRISLDTGSAIALVSEGSPVRHEMKQVLGGRQMVMTQTAAGEFQNALRVAGPGEKARAERLLSRITIIPDNPSVRSQGLVLTKKVGANDKVIFGTADRLGIRTLTSDAKFLRGASAQGVNFEAFVHSPQPLKGI